MASQEERKELEEETVQRLDIKVIREEDQRMSGYIERLLNSGLTVNDRDDQGNTALHLAIKQANIFLNERLKALYIDIKNIYRSSLQYLAVRPIRKSYVPAIRELIIKDPSAVNAERKDSFTPLHLAAESGQTEVG